jgi:hypothetical protein
VGAWAKEIQQPAWAAVANAPLVTEKHTKQAMTMSELANMLPLTSGSSDWSAMINPMCAPVANRPDTPPTAGPTPE